MSDQIEREMAELVANEAKPRRARLASVTVQVNVVVDDGDVLEPIPVQSFTVAPAAWPPDLGAVLADIQGQIDQGG